MKNIFTKKYIILLLTLLHACSVLLIILGIFSPQIVWLQLAVFALVMGYLGSYYSVVTLIVNLPFFLALPWDRFQTLQVWRILLTEIFLIYLAGNFKEFIKSKLNFFGWDKYLGFFLLVTILSLGYARFRSVGAREIIFWLNIYALYVLIAAAVRTRQQIIGIIQASALSLSIVVIIGYAQLAITFFTSLGTFWVYWASFVSRFYYGQNFASVLLYSNSWFSYTGKAVELRMFSIMPDSHSFASLCVYAIGFLLCLTYLYDKRTIAKAQTSGHPLEKNISFVSDDNKIFGQKVNYYLWSAVRFTGLAIVLSGTRALWVGLLVPFILVCFSYYTNFLKTVAKKLFWPFIIILLFFVLSPVINRGLQLLQVNKFQEGFLSRVASIYNLDDQANVSRVVLWETSLSYSVKHPLGTGVGNFLIMQNANIPSGASYDNIANAHNSRFNLPEKFVTAHNLFLQILVETGFVGLLAFLAFWWKYFSEVYEFIKKHRAENNIFLFFVVQSAVMFLWFLAAAVFDVTFFNDKVLLFFFISLSLSGVIIRNYTELL